MILETAIKNNKPSIAANILEMPVCRKFSDFESSLFQLEEPVKRNLLFCDFIKCFLLSQPIYQVNKIYFRQEIPELLLQQIKLSSISTCDGVILTNNKEVHIFKIILRKNRERLSGVDVHDFLAEPLDCDYRLIITNADEIYINFENNQNSYSICGMHFDQLSAQELSQLLQLSPKNPLWRPKPRPHQLSALQAIKKGFIHHDRLTSVMACGSGKTLLSLWLLEAMKVRNVVIFLPSLGLLSQTLHEWLKNTVIKDFNYLCVCSDSSVARMADDINYQQGELDFIVTTDPARIRHYFETQKEGSKSISVIFSTYQSAAMVAAGMRSQDQFDLGIFDEAHKTAGDVDKAFSFALLNKQLRIKKRLFLTATPRIIRYQDPAYRAHVKNRYSMDNETVFGPQIFTFNFSDAVNQKIITDCKIIISVVTSDMVNKVLQGSSLKLGGDRVDALTIAHALALEHAAKEHGIKRIITFHSRVEAAFDFSKINKKHSYGLLSNFDLYHVNGDMSAALRAKTLNQFSESQCSILTNARCLTEGIDVPTVDMVAFLSPKKSCIDIVQAAGRAMRQSEGKKYGYVLIPVYIPMEASLSAESLIDGTNFGDVWRVLKSLAEHDTLLQDEICLGQQWRGQSDSYTASKINKIEVVSPGNFDFSTLKDSIKTLCLENVGDNWDFMYGQLIRFKKEYGHPNVATRNKEWEKLASWVVNNRVCYRNNFLSEDRVKKLEAIDFVWDVNEAEWLEQYQELKKFFEKNGHGNIATTDKAWGNLGHWLATNRRVYKKNNLSIERIKKLEDLGVDLNPLEVNWERPYKELEQYQKKHGHINIARTDTLYGALGKWLATNRQNYYANKLSLERIKKLDALGIVWNPRESQWLENYEVLKSFYQEYGHCNVATTDKAWGTLGNWLAVNRGAYYKNKLSLERIEKLESLSVIWNSKENKWLDNYEMLKIFYKEHGHVNVPTADKSWGSLGDWLVTNRSAYQKDKLPLERIKKLDSLGIDWNPLEAQWEKPYKELEQYQKEHGHINIARTDTLYGALGKWLATNRRNYYSNKLSLERIKKLDALGIVWNPRESQWLENYEMLRKYYQEHGHGNVATTDKSWGTLGSWLAVNRGAYYKNKLSLERIKKLESLSVIWNSKENQWLDNYEMLKIFYKDHGHVNVPTTDKSWGSLGDWLVTNRGAYQKNKLSLERIKKLEDLGVDWNPLESQWQKNYKALEEYKKKYGHINISRRDEGYNVLGDWIANNRYDYRNDKISSERIKKLELLNIIWEPKETQWLEKYETLKQFYKKFGHFNVPIRDKEWAGLGNWLGKNRKYYSQGKLASERVKKLEELGVILME